MAWKIEFDPAPVRDLDRLDKPVAHRILSFLHERVAQLDDPRKIGQALHGSRLGEFWKYRVGDWRIICKIEDTVITILVLRIRHRSKVYRP
ncbi:MAG TPA: type II toxin-antitoxin system RelE/ParE family toxin [Deltaproteobacteria bacterium]|nr:type II toxin-antitoxin system RelE/ParE family toxin [Deltaproteobacteria bacterium]